MMSISADAIDISFREIASNMKQLRKKYALTQKELSEKLGLDPQYYARLERGDDPQRRFTLEKIIMACALFDVTPNDIITNIPSVDDPRIDVAGIQMDIQKGMKSMSPEQLEDMREYIKKMKTKK